MLEFCVVKDCTKKKYNRNLMCSSHYHRKQRYGNPLIYKRESHGMSKSPEYRTWCAIKSRCYDKNNTRYHDYGGRGIKVCDRWRNSFLAFYKDMGDKPSEKHSIERINNNGIYSPNNCKWATSVEQRANKRLHKSNKSGFNGIIWDRKNFKWRVQITINGSTFWGGRHKDLNDAIDSLRRITC